MSLISGVDLRVHNQQHADQYKPTQFRWRKATTGNTFVSEG